MGGDLIFFSRGRLGLAGDLIFFSPAGSRPGRRPYFFHQPEAGLGWIYSVLAGQPLPPALASRPEAVTLFSFAGRPGWAVTLFLFQPASRAGPVTLFSFRRAGPVWAMTLFLFEISNKNPICAK